MEDEAAVLEAGSSESPLVTITFQKNVRRKEKFLEAEPKALGVTQIGLSVFQLLCVSVFLAQDLSRMETDVPFLIASLLVIIAGSVAIAAQNLHLPTLQGCLGMQIVACGACVFNIICTLVKMDLDMASCWHYYYDNSSSYQSKMCHHLESTQTHFYAEGVIVQVTLLAISVTLASYCCKVVNCCLPAAKMPVITVQTPPVQQ